MIVKQPGHLTSMKNDRGAGTRVYKRIRIDRRRGQVVLYLELVFAGLGLRRRIEKINGENLGYLDLVILTTIQISWWRRCWSRAEPEEALLLDCADAGLNAPF